MSPRSKVRTIFLILIWMLMPCLLPAAAAGGDTAGPAGSRIIGFYQNHLSGAAGGRCPMFPSCSAYADRAIEKHGPVKGWIMTFDRVMRCGRSETRLAPEIRISGQVRTHDPVSVNDFWWFSPPEDRMPQ